MVRADDAPLPEEDPVEPLWRSRLRWRLRGATMWPVFVVLTVAGGVLIHLRPIAGTETRLMSGLLFVGFANLAIVAVAAPLVGRLVRRARPQLPREIATDRAGTGLLAGFVVLLAVVGTLHHGAIVEEEDDFAAQAAAVRQFVLTQAPATYRRNLEDADTWQPGPDLYRTCVPGNDPRRALCLIVSTDVHPPGVTVDSDRQPNARISGPLNPGRRGG